MSDESLLGRADVIDVIWAFLGRVRQDGAALLISGQTGVGKTALLEGAVEAARVCETRVLLASGVGFEIDVGFAALNQILLPLLDNFHELSDVHRAALSVALGSGDGPGHDRIVVAGAALALLRHAAAPRALLVAVDDLQWVDRSSAAVLAKIARRLAGTQIGFVAAFRSEADTFFESSGLTSIDVQPSDEGSASVLLGTRFPTLAVRVHQRILGEAEGNPLALLELPSALSDRQRAARAPLPGVLPLTRRLHGLFASRVTSLPATTRQRRRSGLGTGRTMTTSHHSRRLIKEIFVTHPATSPRSAWNRAGIPIPAKKSGTSSPGPSRWPSTGGLPSSCNPATASSSRPAHPTTRVT